MLDHLTNPKLREILQSPNSSVEDLIYTLRQTCDAYLDDILTEQSNPERDKAMLDIRTFRDGLFASIRRFWTS